MGEATQQTIEDVSDQLNIPREIVKRQIGSINVDIEKIKPGFLRDITEFRRK